MGQIKIVFNEYCFFLFRVTKMCFDIGIVTCGPNESLVVSGMGYGEIDPDTKEYRPFVVMGRQKTFP